MTICLNTYIYFENTKTRQQERQKTTYKKLIINGNLFATDNFRKIDNFRLESNLLLIIQQLKQYVNAIRIQCIDFYLIRPMHYLHKIVCTYIIYICIHLCIIMLPTRSFKAAFDVIRKNSQRHTLHLIISMHTFWPSWCFYLSITINR